MKFALYRCFNFGFAIFFTLILINSELALAQGTGPAFKTPAGIATSNTSTSMYVVEELDDIVLQIDPTTGNRTVLSNDFTGTGIIMRRVVAITSHGGGSLLVGDRDLDAIIEVNPLTGNRRLVSGCPEVRDPCPAVLVGNGAPLLNPIALSVAADGSLLVVDVGDQSSALIQINLATGDRTPIASSIVGLGPQLLEPVGVTTTEAGESFVLDQALDAIVQIDLATMQRTVTSGCRQAPDPCPPTSLVGRGPEFVRPTSIAASGQRTLLVADADLGAVISVNTNSGTRNVLSDVNRGNGPVFLNPVGIAVESSGDIVVLDASRKAIIRVDRRSGNRTIASKLTDLIISPPSGNYTVGQDFDLSVFIDGPGDISDLSMTLNRDDVTNQIQSCGDQVPLSGGGVVIRCPNVTSVLNLPPGRHRFEVSFTLTPEDLPSRMIERAATWDIHATQ